MAYNRLSPYRTFVRLTPDVDMGEVTYASTRIVEWDARAVVLNSGGWRTVTTKRKMNQAALQFGLPICVWQDKGEWYVCRRDDQGRPINSTKQKFHDGVTISRKAA